MLTQHHYTRVARDLRRDLDRASADFMSIPRRSLTERLREVSGQPKTRIKSLAGEELEGALHSQGLRCHPSLAETSTWDMIRVYRTGTRAGDIIEMVLAPSREADQELAAVISTWLGEREQPTPAVSRSAEILRQLLPRERYQAIVESMDDPDLATT